MARTLIFVALLLGGCSGPVILGVGAASSGVQATTGRSPVDHAVSYTTDKDCQIIRWVSNEKMCVNKPLQNTGINAAELAFAQRRAGQ
jgi:hypothetical protein